MSNKPKIISIQGRVDLLTMLCALMAKRLLEIDPAFSTALENQPPVQAAYLFTLQEGMELEALTANRVKKPRKRVGNWKPRQAISVVIGKLIAKARKANGMSQEECSSRLGISQAQLSRYERGSKVPDRLMDKIEMLLATDIRKSTLQSNAEELLSQHHIASTPELLRDLMGLIKDA